MGEIIFRLLASFIMLVLIFLAQLFAYDGEPTLGIGALMAWSIFLYIFIDSIRLITAG